MGCERSDLSILITDDRGIRALNRTWRAIDAATDVLAFSQLEGRGSPPGSRVLGDVVISLQTAQRQADERGHGIEEELLLLLTHGILHLLGCDHQKNKAEARRMAGKQARVMARVKKISGKEAS